MISTADRWPAALAAAVLVGVAAWSRAMVAPPAEPAAPAAPRRSPPPRGHRLPVRRASRSRPPPRWNPELDSELVGFASPWPADLDPKWTESGLAAVLSGPGVELHCEEWPCLVQIVVPVDAAPAVDRTVDEADLLRVLHEHGWDAAFSRGELRRIGAPGQRERVLVMPIRPASYEPSPTELLRERVRQFWLMESM